MVYIIQYDNDFENNIIDEFTGTWLELQGMITHLKNNGCYNITASCINESEE